MTAVRDALESGIMVEPAPPRFTVTVPANWYPLDLDPRSRTDSIARLVESRIGSGREPAVRQLRRELTAMLRQYARQAASHRATYAALMYQVVDGVPLSASLLIAVGVAPEDASGAPMLTPGALGAVLGEGAAVSSDFATLAGPAVRVVRQEPLQGVAGSSGAPVSSVEVQYALAVPGTELVLVMTFSTPNVALAEPLGELFDAIARTLEWAP
jgi:hypothetical protein